MKTLVNQQNFYLGCRVCMVLLAKESSVSFVDTIPDNIETTYSEAYQNCTDILVSSRCHDPASEDRFELILNEIFFRSTNPMACHSGCVAIVPPS